MSNPARNKGLNAEREAAGILTDLLGIPVSRLTNPGSSHDMGDLYGIPDTVAQVAWWPQRGMLRAVREKPIECEQQRAQAGVPFAVSFIRLNGGIWRAVLTVDQWATYHRETL